MRAQPKASHFVNGAYIEDAAGAAIECVYAANGEVVARLHEATDAVVEAALAAAKAAQPIWAAMTGTERGRVLRRAADMMRDLNREFSEIETMDTGKPLQETLVADATSGADALEYFGGLAGSITGEQIPLHGGDWRIRPANLWAFVWTSGPGIIRRRSPAGRRYRNWPAATRWCSSHLRRHHYPR